MYGCVTALAINLAVRKFWVALAPSDHDAGYRNDLQKMMSFRRVAENYRHVVGEATEEQLAAGDGGADEDGAEWEDESDG